MPQGHSRLILCTSLATAFIIGCSSQTGDSTAASANPQSAVSQVQTPPGPPPPQLTSIPIEPLTQYWSLPEVGTVNNEAFGAALQKYKNIGVVKGGAFAGLTWDQRLDQLVRKHSPTTKVLARSEAALKLLMKEKGELPIRRDLRSIESQQTNTPGMSSSQVRIEWDEVKLNTTWLKEQSKAMKGAEAFLFVDYADLNIQEWTRLHTGDYSQCLPAVQKLDAGYQSLQAPLSEFVRHANSVLDTLYRTQLNASIANIEADLSGYATEKKRHEFGSKREHEQYDCGHRYWKQVQSARTCTQASVPCTQSPQLFIGEGEVVIGSPVSNVHIPSECSQFSSIDPAPPLRKVGELASIEGARRFQPQWTTLANRAAQIAYARTKVNELCLPQRNLIDGSAVDGIRDNLANTFAQLAQAPSVDVSATWAPEPHSRRIAGVGAVEAFAVHRPSQDAGFRVRIDALLEQRDAGMTCRSDIDSPLVLALVDVRSSAIVYSGFLPGTFACQ